MTLFGVSRGRIGQERNGAIAFRFENEGWANRRKQGVPAEAAPLPVEKGAS